VEGARACQDCAFLRRDGATTLLGAIARLVCSLHGDSGEMDWGDTALVLPNPTAWRDALSGEPGPDGARIRARDLFSRFPVALLVSG
jgi:maltooligosyltrehalose synthase